MMFKEKLCDWLGRLRTLAFLLSLYCRFFYIFNSFIEIQFIYHTIHPFEVNNLVVFSLFTKLYNHHYYLSTEYFQHSKKKSHTHQQSFPILPLPSSLATSNLLSILIYLPILDITNKLNYVICDFFCLASFTQHNFFKVHPCCSMCQISFLFYGCIIFHISILHLFVRSSVEGYFGLYFLAITTNAVMNICIHIFRQTYA